MLKQLIFIPLVFLLVMHAVRAQENVITVAPLGLVNKVKFKYESTIGKSITMGTYAIMFIGPFQEFQGIQGQPIIRYYIKKEAPEGFYLQGKAVFGYHISYQGMYEGTTVGAGLAAGYQVMVGNNKNIPIDLSLGLKYNTYPYNTGHFVEPGVSPARWQGIGPGSLLDASVAIGTAF